jgi:hypothetical protein
MKAAKYEIRAIAKEMYMIEIDFRPSYPKIAPLHLYASAERAVRVVH